MLLVDMNDDVTYLFNGKATRNTVKSQYKPWAGYTTSPGGGTPYNGLYGEALPERSTFFRLEVYKRVGISRAEV